MRQRRLFSKKNIAKCCIVLSLLCAAFCCLSVPCSASLLVQKYSSSVGSNGQYVVGWQPWNQLDWTSGNVDNQYFPEMNKKDNYIIKNSNGEGNYLNSVVTWLNTSNSYGSRDPFVYSYNGVGGWRLPYTIHTDNFAGDFQDIDDRSGVYNIYFTDFPYISALKFNINGRVRNLSYEGDFFKFSVPERVWVDINYRAFDSGEDSGFVLKKATILCETFVDPSTGRVGISCDYDFGKPIRVQTLGVNYVFSGGLSNSVDGVSYLPPVITNDMYFLFENGIEFKFSTSELWKIFDDNLIGYLPPHSDDFSDLIFKVKGGMSFVLFPIQELFGIEFIHDLGVIASFGVLVSAVIGVALFFGFRKVRDKF